MKIFISIFLFFVFSACVRSKSAKNVTHVNDEVRYINRLEDSLRFQYAQLMKGKVSSVSNSLMNTLIKSYKNYYFNHPNDSITPFFVDKVQQLYMQQKLYDYAVNWSDTLIKKYPNYCKKGDVLLNTATTIDFFMKDSIRAIAYYSKFLELSSHIEEINKNEVKERIHQLQKNGN